MDIILPKICKFLNYWYHNIAVFIVADFIAACFKEIMVSARWRCRDNSALTCRSYVKYCSINYTIVQLLKLRELLTYVRTRPIFSFWFHELCMDKSILQALVPRIMNRIYKLHSYPYAFVGLVKNFIHLINAWNMSNCALYGPFAKLLVSQIMYRIEYFFNWCCHEMSKVYIPSPTDG